MIATAAGGQAVRRPTLWMGWKALMRKAITRSNQRTQRRAYFPPRRAYLEHACMAREMDRL